MICNLIHSCVLTEKIGLTSKIFNLLHLSDIIYLMLLID